MIFVNVHEAKTHLSKLIKRAAAGEEVVVARAGRPVARIVAYEASTEPRAPGVLAVSILWIREVPLRRGFEDVAVGDETSPQPGTRAAAS